MTKRIIFLLLCLSVCSWTLCAKVKIEYFNWAPPEKHAFLSVIKAHGGYYLLLNRQRGVKTGGYEYQNIQIVLYRISHTLQVEWTHKYPEEAVMGGARMVADASRLYVQTTSYRSVPGDARLSCFLPSGKLAWERQLMDERYDYLRGDELWLGSQGALWAKESRREKGKEAASWFAAYDLEGKRLWERPVEGEMKDMFINGMRCKDGRCYLYGVADLTKKGAKDLDWQGAVFALDESNGDLLWKYIPGHDVADEITALEVKADGQLEALGWGKGRWLKRLRLQLDMNGKMMKQESLPESLEPSTLGLYPCPAINGYVGYVTDSLDPWKSRIDVHDAQLEFENEFTLPRMIKVLPFDPGAIVVHTLEGIYLVRLWL